MKISGITNAPSLEFALSSKQVIFNEEHNLRRKEKKYIYIYENIMKHITIQQ